MAILPMMTTFYFSSVSLPLSHAYLCLYHV
jgi:hypothetical protein